jgi:hypothetical protein
LTQPTAKEALLDKTINSHSVRFEDRKFLLKILDFACFAQSLPMFAVVFHAAANQPFDAPLHLLDGGLCWFNRTFDSYECSGLVKASFHLPDVSTCRNSCCANSSCDTYQFAPDGSCWVGSSEAVVCRPSKSKEGWIGEGMGRDASDHTVSPAITAQYNHDSGAFT